MTLDYGPETIIRLDSGASIRCDTYKNSPEGATYVRICDPNGKEVAYWSVDEWQQEPALVMGAILGAACGAQ